jgi:hypothetical protein
MIEIDCDVGGETGEEIYLTPHLEWEAEEGRLGGCRKWSPRREVFVECVLDHGRNSIFK